MIAISWSQSEKMMSRCCCLRFGDGHEIRRLVHFSSCFNQVCFPIFFCSKMHSTFEELQLVGKFESTREKLPSCFTSAKEATFENSCDFALVAAHNGEIYGFEWHQVDGDTWTLGGVAYRLHPDDYRALQRRQDTDTIYILIPSEEPDMYNLIESDVTSYWPPIWKERYGHLLKPTQQKPDGMELKRYVDVRDFIQNFQSYFLTVTLEFRHFLKPICCRNCQLAEKACGQLADKACGQLADKACGQLACEKKSSISGFLFQSSHSTQCPRNANLTNFIFVASTFLIQKLIPTVLKWIVPRRCTFSRLLTWKSNCPPGTNRRCNRHRISS
jgi:hypothetical protein